ncbi:hypothetical protein SEUCBS139899_008338 [Sporothrix eucalyptigena]
MSLDMDDLAFGGPRKDGEDQRAMAESESLLHGLECSVSGDVDLLDMDFDERDSLFGGDADMVSLFAGAEDNEQQNQTLTLPLPCPLTLRLPPPPLPLPVSSVSSAVRQTTSSESFCDVSTFFPELLNHQQQQQPQFSEQQGLAMPDQGLGDILGLHFDLDFDVDFGQAVELEVAHGTQEQQLRENDQTSPNAAAAYHDEIPSVLQAPAPGIDTLFRATGLSTPDDQEGYGRAADNGHEITNDDGDDDDIVILSSRQIQLGFVNVTSSPLPAPLPQPPPVIQTSIPHYLELRPRCPRGPPPARIDLSHNVEELLPHVQLHSKLSIRGIQDLLGLDADAGRYLVAACQRHLADPAHTVTTSGSADPTALRVLKVTLILSSLALLVEGGVGPRWFGPETPLEPKSMHVWPDDSTTLTLLFIQLLYRLTRNNNARARHRKRTGTSSRSPKGKATKSPIPTSPPPESATPPKSSTPPKEQPRPQKRKRRQKKAAPAQAAPQQPLPAPLPSRPIFAYCSPRVIRDNLLNNTVNKENTPVDNTDTPTDSVEASEASAPPSKAPSPAAAAADLLPARRPPADAVLHYRVNVVDRTSQQRIVPQIVLAHEGAVRDAGYSYVVNLCAQLDQTVDTVSIVTLLGLERVGSDVGWDRVVGRVHDELLMDGEVRVLVCLQ